jgi:hypothetical protein
VLRESVCWGGEVTRKFWKEKKTPKTIKKAARCQKGLTWHWSEGKVEEF